MKKEEIYTLQLVDGLKSQVGDKKVAYKTVILRETGVGDELAAVALAERLLYVGGKPTLILSDEIYRVALTMRHIEKFVCTGLDDIGQDVLNLEMIGRLSSFDMQRIEERCLVIGLAAQVRYGLITEAEFNSMLNGEATPEQAIAPRSEGQTEKLGDVGAEHQSGPSMLADRSAQRS
jgi:phage FluMu protein gp41